MTFGIVGRIEIFKFYEIYFFITFFAKSEIKLHQRAKCED